MRQPHARSTLISVAAALVLVACGQAAPTPPPATVGPQLTPVPAADRRAFMSTAGNTVVIGEPTQAPDQLSIWLDDGLREQMATDSAFVVQLDYPVITNNAGWEVLVVAPDRAGDWRIWIAR
jgi:hypothetical protein